jgi:hypothetical protein
VVAEQSLQQPDELATEIPTTSANGASSNTNFPEGSGSQQAMQDTHQKASKVLNAFGLDAGAVANTSGASSGKGGLINSTQGGLAKSQKESTSHIGSAGILTPLLLNIGGSEQLWNQFITIKVEQLITNKKFSVANKIIPYLTDTEKFITLSGHLLNTSNQPRLAVEINLNVERRIKKSPLELKANYLSQAAKYQNETGAANLLFNRATSSLQVISDPHKKLISTLKVATSFFKTGDTTTANLYFKKINMLLPKIKTAESQIHSRVAISQAFQEVGQTAIALNWLKSTDKFIKGSDKLGFQELVNGYAHLNKTNKVFQLVKQAPATVAEDELLYNAVKVSLASGLNNDAISYVNSIQGSTSKALAYTLLAGYLKDNSTYLLSAETLLKNIDTLFSKAIVSSRIAQQYASLGDTKKVNELFKSTEQFIKALPASGERDKLLQMVITNYAQPLMQKSLNNLVSYIQAPGVKTDINKKINQLTEISALL